MKIPINIPDIDDEEIQFEYKAAFNTVKNSLVDHKGGASSDINLFNEIENKSSIDHSSQIAVLEEKVAALESKKEVNVSGIDTRSKINEKSIKLLELKIEELKAAANPLGG